MEDGITRAADQPSAAPLSPEVQKAEQLDAAGEHLRAIDVLAAAARRNDAEALTRLGKRLLVGDRAPHLPKDAVRLLEQALAQGGAEAGATLSVLSALGAIPEAGLGRALELLTVAAERNWLPAQAQLRLLASTGGSEAGLVDTTARDWAGLAHAVDLAAWQRVPSGEDLCEAPQIRYFPQFVDDDVCQWLIDRATGRLTRALVYEALSRKTMARDTRTNTVANLNVLQTDLVCILVQQRIARCLDVPLRHLEPIAMLHYAEGEEITEHFDFVDPDVPNYAEEIAARGQRIVTFLVYLNDDYSGGETQFPELGLSHKGRRGEALFFVNALPDGSADIRTLHAGRPPLNGEKWVVSQFVRNRPTF